MNQSADNSQHSDSEPDDPAAEKLKAISNRREFITGMGAIKTIRENANAQLDAVDASWSSTGDDAGVWEQYAKRAMACEFEISFNLHQYRQAASATMLAFQLIDDLEDQLTIYRDHSEVSQLNQLAPQTPQAVEVGLLELLRMAKQIHQDTGGAFDVTSGQLSQLWGFESRKGAVPLEDKIASVLKLVGSDFLVIDEANQKLSITETGVKINLGGIGKGYSLDRVAELFAQHSIYDFVIHGGQSSVLARGGSGELVADEPAEQRCWRVGISHPTAAGVRLAEIQLRNQALGTSGTARQGFFHRGKRYGHIIDPRSGWPTNHFLSTTVVSPLAAVSDALATAFFVMKPEEIFAFCENRPELKAVLVSEVSRNSTRVKVTTINFNASEIIVYE